MCIHIKTATREHTVHGVPRVTLPAQFCVFKDICNFSQPPLQTSKRKPLGHMLNWLTPSVAPDHLSTIIVPPPQLTTMLASRTSRLYSAISPALRHRHLYTQSPPPSTSTLVNRPATRRPRSLSRPLHATTASAHGYPQSEVDPATAVNVIFVGRDGGEYPVLAPPGKSLLEVAHANNIDLEGACEGSLACSTCHVYLDQKTFHALEEPCDDENDMLDLAFGLSELYVSPKLCTLFFFDLSHRRFIPTKSLLLLRYAICECLGLALAVKLRRLRSSTECELPYHLPRETWLWTALSLSPTESHHFANRSTFTTSEACRAHTLRFFALPSDDSSIRRQVFHLLVLSFVQTWPHAARNDTTRFVFRNVLVGKGRAT